MTKQEKSSLCKSSLWKDRFVSSVFGDDVTVCADFDTVYEWALSKLTDREQFIVKRYFEDLYRMQEIGNELGLSRQRIHCILHTAKSKLQHPSIKREFLSEGCAVSSFELRKREVINRCREKGLLESEEVLLLSVTSIGLTVKASNALLKAGILCVGDILLFMLKHSLCSIDHLGSRAELSILNGLRGIGIDSVKYYLERLGA